MNKVTDLLQEKYGLTALPGTGRYVCPKCHHNTLTIHRADTIAKCWNPSCNFGERAQNEKPALHNCIQRLANYFSGELKRGESPQAQRAFEWLCDARGFEKQVCIDARVGVIPANAGAKVREIFDTAAEALSKQLSEAQAKLDAIVEVEKESRKSAGNERAAGRHPKDPAREKLAGTIARLSEETISLRDNGETIATRADKYAGCVVFPYCAADMDVVTLQARFPGTRNIYFLYHGSPVGVFGLSLFNFHEDGTWAQKLLVTEGPTDTLAVQSVVRRATNGKYVFCVGIVSSNAPDIETIKKITGGERPVFIQDSDNAGTTLIKNVSKELSVEVVEIPPPHKDADAYVQSFRGNHAAALEALKRIIENRTVRTKDIKTVALQVKDALQRHGNKDTRGQRDLHSDAANIIETDILERGKLFYAPANRTAFFLNGETLQLFEIAHGSFLYDLFVSRYGVNKKEPFATFLAAHLQTAAFSSGIEARINTVFFYDHESDTQYFSDFNNGFYKITPDAIKHRPNGTDSVLFLSDPKCDPWELVDTCAEPFSWLDKLIINSTNFADGVLSVDEQRLLFRMVLLSFAFGPVLRTRPISAFIGIRGSGKSSAARAPLIMLYGGKSEVKAVPKEQSDFIPLLLRGKVIAFDNADSWRDWLDDLLCIISTGGDLGKRKLYSDNDPTENKPDVFLILTSRTPKFTRDDTADRLLIFYLELIQNKIAEAARVEEIIQHRNELLTEYTYLLQNAVAALAQFKGERIPSTFRLADFFEFCIKIARAQGPETESRMRGIFRKMQREQSDFTLGHDPLFIFLSEWIEIPGNAGKQVTAADLCSEFSELACVTGRKFKYNPAGLSTHLKNIKQNLLEHFEIKDNEKNRVNQKLYAFRKRDNKDNFDAETA